MSKPKFTRILSIDGGGIRGIIPGQILVKLEDILRHHDPDARLADYFDIITGTSTGGILACALLKPESHSLDRPQYTAKEVAGLYLENGNRIFKVPFWRKLKTQFGVFDEKYSVKSLEGVLNEYFGDTMLSDLLKPTVITSYDIERRHGHFFMQHKANKKIAYDFRVVDVARSTLASLTFHGCAHILSRANEIYSLINGGVFANNPAMCGYTEAREIFNTGAKDMVILSLGTGSVKKPYHFNKARKWSISGWLPPLIDIMMASAADVTDHQLEQIFESVQKTKQYVRINPVLNEDEVNSEMNHATCENMQALKGIGIKTAMDKELTLKRVAELLMMKEDSGIAATDKKVLTADN